MENLLSVLISGFDINASHINIKNGFWYLKFLWKILANSSIAIILSSLFWNKYDQ